MLINKPRSFIRIIFSSFLIILILIIIFRSSINNIVYENYKDQHKGLNNEITKSTLGFDHIYVVSLAKRQDRLKKMNALLKALNLDVEYFTAISTEDYETLNRFNNSTYLQPTHKACFVSHYLIHLSIAYNRYESALILEDDIDIELNIESIMTYIHSVLPSDWDILYIGHCMGWEGAFDSPIVESSETFKLYPSKKPYCTHAYAVSAAGVLKIIKELHELYIPIDLQLMSKIDEGILKAYSVAPAAIIQTNDNPSDVSPGADFLEHQTLINSTLRSLGL